ncbi:hypothetical protein J1N35_025377 [Gossypium stocksii]|uniref:Cytochrome b5 heme-binding domain-containing protein n=1 Tax=Gossypium stocksii TaxID=47602 RepID=A0A9D3V6F6_9ROSI|nr:hypothetical protein J1N35_025377 [Gossypium stocksii]
MRKRSDYNSVPLRKNSVGFIFLLSIALMASCLHLWSCCRGPLRNDCWLLISGKVYNVTQFLEDHSGEVEVLLAASVPGTPLDLRLRIRFTVLGEEGKNRNLDNFPIMEPACSYLCLLKLLLLL